jgi:SAM-dependent methyltransferase
MATMVALQGAYLLGEDAESQSGFSGGRERWVEERSPLVEAIDRDGELLDVGCANGLLAADLVSWAADKGVTLVAHGVDLGEGLVQMARQRMPENRANFVVADAWHWQPGRTWDYVYGLIDLAPAGLTCPWFRLLAGWVAPGGRLIIGSYGSRSRGEEPIDVAGSLAACGFQVAGSATGGHPANSVFAWVDLPSPG